MTAEKTWFECCVEERMREHEERIRLREMKTARKEAGIRRLPAERVRESARSTSRATEAAVWSRNTGGTSLSAQGPRTWWAMRKPSRASTGPKTPEGRQRIAEALRRRWHAGAAGQRRSRTPGHRSLHADA